MTSILVATDFSVRSDRALRRAIILATCLRLPLRIVHVVDDDRPLSFITADRQVAERLLEEQVRTLQQLDNVSCDWRIINASTFDGILRTAEDLDPALIVIGAHRRHLLLDILTGTTAERLIRRSRWPVLMANSDPSGAYRHIIASTDFSDGARAALVATHHIGLDGGALLSVVHVYDTPAVGLMVRSSTTSDQIRDYEEGEKHRAEVELKAFLRNAGVTSARGVLRKSENFPAMAIADTAHELRADLVVCGSRGKSGLAKIFLGSVTQSLMSLSGFDLLVVPLVPSAN